jgi:hypothetical protein
MPFPTSYVDTELSAVNQILAAVGQAPVTELDQTNPEISLAYDTLVQCAVECQSEGWGFNTEFNYPLTPDTSGYINIASNMLMVDLSDTLANAGLDVVKRAGKLYETTNHTFIWPTDKAIECDVVWLFDWTDMPPPFRNYVIARASTLMSLKVIGESTQYQLLQQREALQRSIILEHECNQGDYSMFGFKRGENYYVSYQPYQSLLR